MSWVIRGSLRIPAAEDRGTAAVALEAPAGRLGIAIALPAAAEGVVPALMADESLHVIQRIAQKDADLVGKFLLQTEAGGQLPQAVAGRLPRGVAHSAQKIPVFSAAQHLRQIPLPVQVEQVGARAAAALEDDQPQSTGGELLPERKEPAHEKGAVPGTEAEQAGGLYPGQSGGAVLDQRLFKGHVWDSSLS